MSVVAGPHSFVAVAMTGRRVGRYKIAIGKIDRLKEAPQRTGRRTGLWILHLHKFERFAKWADY